MNQYARLEDELSAAKIIRTENTGGAILAGVVGVVTAYMGADAIENKIYNWGAALAFVALTDAIVCAGNLLKIYGSNANISRIQREIGYIKQEKLEKRIGG